MPQSFVTTPSQVRKLRRSLRCTPLAAALAALATLGGASSVSAAPTLERVWGTYFGGEGGDRLGDIALDAAGNIYTVGWTNSTAGIATPGAHKTALGGNVDAYLAKFDPEGTLVWGTYFGGEDEDTAYRIATGGDSVVIVGRTSSLTGVATPGALQGVFGGGYDDGFAASFTSDGALQWSTYLGTDGGTSYLDELASGVAVDVQDFVYIGGGIKANVTGLGTPGTHHPVFSNDVDNGYLVKFTPQGEVVWGTYYGGYPGPLSVNPLGEIYMAGVVVEPDATIPSVGAHQTVYNGKWDNFLVRFNPDGTRAWATFYGGAEQEATPRVQALPQGGVLLAGRTASPSDIATPGAHQPEHGGGLDTFITRFDGAGTRLWGTYYGGDGDDFFHAVVTDQAGGAYICGRSPSADGIATPNGYQSTPQSDMDAFMAKFDGDGARQWGTYYGGNNTSDCGGVAVDGLSRVHMYGHTNSTIGIATPGSHDQIVEDFDGFIAQFMQPTEGACIGTDDCGGGPCVDGVCCDSACGDGADDCQTCSLRGGASADGVCTPLAAAVVCRPSAGTCDAAEHCTGDAGTCPADAPSADGEPCDEGMCSAGACVPVEASTGDDPMGDTTDDPGAPSSSGEQPTTAPTDDTSGTAETSGTGDTSSTGSDTEADAGGSQQDDGSGCGCRSNGGGAALLGFPLLLLLAPRRRR